MSSMTTPTSKGSNGDGPDQADNFGIPTLAMANDRPGAPQAEPSADGWPAGHRHRRTLNPRREMNRAGRALRYIMGVDEALMERVHLERATYAAFGALLIMTSIVAGFSMWFAVQEMAGIKPWAAILPAVIWLLFIYNMDRLIVTSRPAGAWDRWIMFVTRTALAVLLGTVIAEPLVLKVFQSQIEAQVKKDRQAELRDLETKLIKCNPDPGDATAAAPPAYCTSTQIGSSSDSNYLLSVTTNPAAQAATLKGLQSQADALDRKIKNEQAEIKSLNDIAAKECNGTKGPGLSGKYGNGINCKTDRENARQYEDSAPLITQQADLKKLDDQITVLQGEISTARVNFASERDKQIRARVDELTPVNAPIGLLERMAALSEIGGQNAVLAVGIWFVRLLFICIDCSPVLIKMTHRSKYEQIVDTVLDDGIETFRAGLQGKDSERAMAQEERDQQRREHAIRMDQRLADAVDARAAAYERQAWAEGKFADS